MLTICYHILFLFKYFLSLHVKPQLNLLSYFCPAQFTSTQVRGGVASQGGTQLMLSHLEVSVLATLSSITNGKEEEKTLSFDVLVSQHDRPRLLKPSHSCFLPVSMNKQSGYHDFVTFK